jgi:hypothetical protein
VKAHIPDTDTDYLTQRVEYLRRATAETDRLPVPVATPQPGCLRRFASLLVALVRLPTATCHPGDSIISRQPNRERIEAINREFGQ